jgi:hypothetical protein
VGYPVTDFSAVTYSALRSYPTGVYDTSAVVGFDGLYSSMDICYNDVQLTYYGTGGSGSDISGLLANYPYTIYTYSRNIVGDVTAGNTIIFTTLPKITTATAAAFDSSAATVVWDGSFSVVNLYSYAYNTSIILNYKFDVGDVNGTILKDYTGNYNGKLSTKTTIYPSISTNTYKYGTGSMYFSMTNKQYLNIPSMTLPSSTVGFTISMWYYFNTFKTYSWLFSFNSGTSNNLGLQCGTGALMYQIKSTSGTTIYNTFPIVNSATTGVWHHLVWVVTETQSIFYLDGVSSVTTTVYPPTSLVNNNINNFYDNGSLNTSLFNDVYVDEFSIYQGALTNSQILALYDSNKYVPLPTLDSYAPIGTYLSGTTSAIVSSLQPNTQYYFRVDPSGAGGVGYPVTDFSAVTYSALSSYPTGVYDTSAVIGFDGSYSSVDICYNDVRLTYYGVGGSGSDISGLLANYPYTIYTYSRNIAGAVTAGNTITFTTLPKITTATAAAFDSSAITVTWDGSFSVVNLYVSNVAGVYGSAYGSYLSGGTKTAVVGGLDANTQYYFRVDPSGEGGVGYPVADVSMVTLGSFIFKNVTMHDVSAAITFDGSFSLVDICYNTVKLSYNVPGTTGSADISGLTPDVSYTFIGTAYNTYNNTSITTYTAVTNPRITSFAVSAYDTSAVSIAWGGTNYTSIHVQWNLSGSVFETTDTSMNITTSSPYILNGLSYINPYYFRATPIGKSSATGYTWDASAVPLVDLSGIVFGLILYT